MPHKIKSLYEISKAVFRVFLKKWLSRLNIYLASATESMEKPDSGIELHKFRTPEDFNAYKDRVVHERFRAEQDISAKNKNNKYWNIAGFCECCQKHSRFLVDWKWSEGGIPSFRDRLICEHCGLTSRQRFTASYLKRLLKEQQAQVPDVYLYEQISPFYSFIKKNVTGINIIGSEYLGSSRRPGEIIRNIRHEDALNLSFKDKSMDFIIANDVYEHVPDIQRVLKEASRVLRKNGKLLFTIPFDQAEKTTRQRAVIEKEEVRHLLPEQYHSDPISKRGSLVFYDFGWDIFDFLKRAGFKDAYILVYYSLFYGYMGNGLQFMFVAER